MIGSDTNVLIRYIVQDDSEQAMLATEFIENQCNEDNPAFINEITLCEVVWVLKRAYKYEKEVILNILQQLLKSCEIIIASEQCAVAAYQDYETGNADFSDYFIVQLNKQHGCRITLSFDKKACKHPDFKCLSS